jgi:hypothetical protein
MNTLAYRTQGCWSMIVIGRGNGAAINLLTHFIEHLTIITISFRLGPFLGRTATSIEIHITKGNYLTYRAGSTYVTTSFAPDTNAGHGQALIRAKDTGWEKIYSDRRGCTGLEHVASGIGFDKGFFRHSRK